MCSGQWEKLWYEHLTAYKSHSGWYVDWMIQLDYHYKYYTMNGSCSRQPDTLPGLFPSVNEDSCWSFRFTHPRYRNSFVWSLKLNIYSNVERMCLHSPPRITSVPVPSEVAVKTANKRWTKSFQTTANNRLSIFAPTKMSFYPDINFLLPIYSCFCSGVRWPVGRVCCSALYTEERY